MTQGALVKALAQQLETTPAQSKEFLNALATIATTEVKKKTQVSSTFQASA